MRIPDTHLCSLLRHGYAIVPRFLSPEELSRARLGMLSYFPLPEELAATPERFRGLLDQIDFLQREFPFTDDALCQNAVHPDILGFVERALGTADILLSRAAIWAKYAGHGAYGQALHCDYEGNTLAYPRQDGDYRQVNIILYYSDVTPRNGPTYVVPQEYTQEKSLWPPFRPRPRKGKKGNLALYKHEKPVLVRAGGMLIFGMQTFHRASAMTAVSGVRFTQHLVYRAARHHFAGYQNWASFGEQAEMHRFLELATPRQRAALGFPLPGDPYWTRETLRGTARRYPGMDMTPYRQPLGKRPR